CGWRGGRRLGVEGDLGTGLASPPPLAIPGAFVCRSPGPCHAARLGKRRQGPGQSLLPGPEDARVCHHRPSGDRPLEPKDRKRPVEGCLAWPVTLETFLPLRRSQPCPRHAATTPAGTSSGGI